MQSNSQIPVFYPPGGTGDQNQNRKATLRQMELILAAVRSGKLVGRREGAKTLLGTRRIQLHIFSITRGPRAAFGNVHGVPSKDNFISEWSQLHCNGDGCDVVWHLDEDLVKTVDGFISADVLGLGFSTLSQTAGFIAQGTVAWMRGWPAVNIKTGATEDDERRGGGCKTAPFSTCKYINEIPHLFLEGGLSIGKWLSCAAPVQVLGTSTVHGGTLCTL
jgi:hypothetical protein